MIFQLTYPAATIDAATIRGSAEPRQAKKKHDGHGARALFDVTANSLRLACLVFTHRPASWLERVPEAATGGRYVQEAGRGTAAA